MKRNIVKAILAMLLLFLCCIKTNAQSESSMLVLWHADGTTTEIALFKKPQILFATDKILITSQVLNLEYDAADVVRFTYKGVATSFESLNTEPCYEYRDEGIVFNGIKDTDKVVIYNAAGIRIPVRLKKTNGGQFLQLSSLPVGVYILNVNGKSTKFTKK